MPLRNLAKWLRWSNTWQAWQERLGVLGILAAALSLWWVADAVPAWAQVLGWASLVLLLAFFSRRGWLKLFGPVLFYDLVRNARRTSFFAYRVLYLGILLLLLCWMYLSWRKSYLLTEPVTSSEAAELALLFFITFMAVQIVFVIVLTPAFTASAIAEEKERRTIEFILATDLRNREIVFGKLLSRLAFLTLFILAGLPVLSALQFLGGFSPRALLVGFTGTYLTMVSLAAVSMLASVLARRTRDALFLVYLLLIGYLGVTVLAHIQLNNGAGNRFPSTANWESPLTLEDVLLWIRAGNPMFAVMNVMSNKGLDEDALVRALGSYASLHGLLAVVCVAASIALLRRASLKVESAPRAPMTARPSWRPGPGQWPMIWKEVWAERLVKRRWVVGVGLLLLMVLSFLPVGFIVTDYYRTKSQAPTAGSFGAAYWSDPWEQLGREINAWLRAVGMLVTLLGMAGVGVRAAASVRGEHDKDTMTPLLLSGLSSEEILFGKWLGSITSMRWFVVWLGLIWCVGVALNGLSPSMVPLLASASLLYAGAAASIGLWCSVVCKTSLRAMLSTLLIGLVLFGAHWLPWLMCMPLIDRPGKTFQFVAEMQGALTPPVVMAALLPNAPHDFESHRSDPLEDPYWLTFLGVSGAAAWGGFAWFVWTRANERFKKEGGRLESVAPARYVPTDADHRGTSPGLHRGRELVDRVQAHGVNDRVLDHTDSTG
jgi:ABC-type transport system involved in multi-copper enzyme maturation permease subunit